MRLGLRRNADPMIVLWGLRVASADDEQM